MNRVAIFEKVSYSQFAKDWKKYEPEADDKRIQQVYADLRLPLRATAGSAGYDFGAPVNIVLEAGREALVPTGIRVKIIPGYVLFLLPRSSLGFKYRMQLDNTVGVIDSDYYGADNEGHIMCKLINDSRESKTLEIAKGAGMVQGIFLPFGITDDDNAQQIRTGGFGSTTK